jgi:hypothetical protein
LQEKGKPVRHHFSDPSFAPEIFFSEISEEHEDDYERNAGAQTDEERAFPTEVEKRDEKEDYRNVDTTRDAFSKVSPVAAFTYCRNRFHSVEVSLPGAVAGCQ